MALILLSDELWQEVQPLLPPELPKPQGGRPRVPDQDCLRGIIFVLRTGLPWGMLPAELGCGSGVTCWRRLHDWIIVGVWPEIHRRLLAALGRLEQLDLSRTVIDSASVRAVFGGCIRGRTPRIGRNRAVNAIS
jgi:transposase